MSTQGIDASTTRSPVPWADTDGVQALKPFPGPLKAMRMPTKNIEEPTMRSVAIAYTHDLPKMPSFGLAASKSRLKAHPGPFELQQTSISPKIAPMKIYPSAWKVPDAALNNVPEYFCLERTHRFISCTSATTVSTRISDCLRDLLVEVKYDDKKAKATCKNKHMDKYCVRLFRGRGAYDHGVIVEVQRRRGSARTFMSDCRAILNAAEGEYSEEMNCIKYTIPADLKEGNVCMINQDQIRNPTKVASDLLLKEGSDSKILAAELLCLDTDCSKTDPKTALIIAKSILDEGSSIFNFIASTLESQEWSSSDDEVQEKLYYLTLVLLFNTLYVTKENNSLHDIASISPWFIEKLIPILIDIQKKTQTFSQVGAMAAKTLNCLTCASEEAKMRAEKIGVQTVFI